MNGRKTIAGGKTRDLMLPLRWLMFGLPFFAGGFHQLTCAVTGVLLMGYLIWQGKQGSGLLVSSGLIAVAVLTAGYGLSAFWAADRGMAVYGVVRMLPVLLFGLALSRFPEGERKRVWDLVPLSGVVMTALSYGLQLIPSLKELVTVSGRLAGFFGYPNAFAAFLIVGLVISAFDENRRPWAPALDGLLIFGVFQSGSRIGFLVLLVILGLLLILRKEGNYRVGTVALLAGCFALSLLPGLLGGETAADRYLSISGSSSSMLGRLLYYLDGVKLILRHPFGLGYLGWSAVQGSIQSGVYSVTMSIAGCCSCCRRNIWTSSPSWAANDRVL